MSHSTHGGFSAPPICSDSGRLFLANVSGLALPERQSRDVGVANVRAETASTRLPPSLPFGSVTRPPWLPSVALGVGNFAIARYISVRFMPDDLAPLHGRGFGSMKFRGGRPPLLKATAFVLLASGVGNQPNPVSAVRGADGRSGDAIPDRVIPDLGQVSENGSHPETKQAWDVLHDDEARS